MASSAERRLLLVRPRQAEEKLGAIQDLRGEIFDELYDLGAGSVLTLTLMIEILSNLKKAAKDGRTPEVVVSNLADKIDMLGTTPNVDYAEIVTANLIGYPVDMRRVPVFGGGRIVTAADDRRVSVHDEPPEMWAVHRWQAGDFAGMEYEMADQWRRAIRQINLGEIHRTLGWTKGRRPEVNSLSDVLAWVDNLLDNGPRAHVLKVALQLLPVPREFHSDIGQRWSAGGVSRMGRPSLFRPAPGTMNEEGIGPSAAGCIAHRNRPPPEWPLADCGQRMQPH